MIVLRQTVLIFPWAYLPFLYTVQHRFESELAAQISIVMLQLIVMVLLPFATAILKVGETTSGNGDLLSNANRLVFAAYPLASTVMFNSEMVKWMAEARFVEAKSLEELEAELEAEGLIDERDKQDVSAVVDADGSADGALLDEEDSGDLADIDTESEEANEDVSEDQPEAPALVEEEFGSSSYP